MLQINENRYVCVNVHLNILLCSQLDIANSDVHPDPWQH